MPSAAQTSQLAERVAADLASAGWRLERVLSDNGSEFKGEFSATVEQLGARQSRIRPAGRRPTATSRRSTKRSSTSAGDGRSRAF
jgi:hypothetical protein